MRRNLCQMWNCSPAELALMDARKVHHETSLIVLYESEMAKKAQNGRR